MHSKPDINLNDKNDFPELVPTKKSDPKHDKEKEDIKQVFGIAKSKPATYQKKINQEFPTLGQVKSEPVPKKEEEEAPT